MDDILFPMGVILIFIGFIFVILSFFNKEIDSSETIFIFGPFPLIILSSKDKKLAQILFLFLLSILFVILTFFFNIWVKK